MASSRLLAWSRLRFKKEQGHDLLRSPVEEDDGGHAPARRRQVDSRKPHLELTHRLVGIAQHLPELSLGDFPTPLWRPSSARG